MKVILPKFDSTDTIDLSGLTEDHFVIVYVNGKPCGVLLSDDEGVEFWIQGTMSVSPYTDRFNTIYEAVEDFIGQYPNATFEAYE